MLYRLHSNIFVIGLLTFGTMAAMIMERTMNVMTLVPLVSFITQMALMLYFARDEERIYSDTTIFITVYSYTFLLAVFYMLISEYYDGDHFMFSKADAMFYYKESMKVQTLGLFGNIERIINTFDADDYGALIFQTVMMYLIPDKLFTNAAYILFGAIASVFLYRIAKHYMPASYAFLAVLGYSTSSYITFFHCTFLKESLFIFIVISTCYLQQQAIYQHSKKALALAGICIAILMFFRPAVAAFLAASIFVYYGITQKKNALSVFLYIAAIGIFAISLTKMQEIVETNTAGGDYEAMLSENNNGSYSSSFNMFVSFFGAFLGPFPSLFPKLQGPSTLEFLGAGLIYKLFLVFPFWYGVYKIIRNKIVEFYPILVFTLLELLLVGAVLSGLELRKVLLHMPFTYIIAFYGMYHGFIPSRLNRLSAIPCYLFAVGVLFLWNVIKVNN